MESHKIHVPNHQPVILLLYTSVGTTFWRQGTLEVPCSIRRFMVPWQAAFVAGPGGQGARGPGGQGARGPGGGVPTLCLGSAGLQLCYN